MENKELALPMVNLHAAGIDVGSRNHMVAIDQNRENVREFGVYTKDHEELIAHLKDFGITNVAMESTGTYWQTLLMRFKMQDSRYCLSVVSRLKMSRGVKRMLLIAFGYKNYILWDYYPEVFCLVISFRNFEPIIITAST